MKILLIDSDSVIPNIALMRISSFYKSQGYEVDLIRLGLSYYPHRRNKYIEIDNSSYDYCFCSSIFNDNYKYVIGENICHGGTGFDYRQQLSIDIESHPCDYSIYPENDTSYGFISRGCIRRCNFCQVWKKEGYIRQVADVSSIIRHKKVKFLDNNFLALPNHYQILEQLLGFDVRVQFNQGLDIRLIDRDNSLLLSKLNYLGDYIFAWDDIALERYIVRGLELMSWRRNWMFKFFVYVSPEQELSEAIYRINKLKELKCLPYVMRDISCWDSQYSDFYKDIAAYTNQVHCLKSMTFFEFLNKRHTNKERIHNSSLLYKINS